MPASPDVTSTYETVRPAAVQAATAEATPHSMSSGWATITVALLQPAGNGSRSVTGANLTSRSMTVALAARKPIHETHAVAEDGAVDADGHILEPPDLWETYIDPAFRDRALRIVLDENGLEELEIDGRRSQMSRRGFPSTLGAMGAPDLAAMMKDPARTYLHEAPYGSMHPAERIELLDAEHIDTVILYTTVGLLWEAEVEDPALSQAYTKAYNRWICEFCAGEPRLVPTAHLSLSDPVAAAAELERAVGEGAKGGYVAPFTHDGRPLGHPDNNPVFAAAQDLDVPLAIHPTFEPQWTKGTRMGRGSTSSSSACWRRCRRPTASATSSRRCSTTACSTPSRASRSSCWSRAAGGSATGSTASTPCTRTRSSANGCRCSTSRATTSASASGSAATLTSR